ncbi:MAG: sel1 repeat family protein [Alphaproteobacteria bacterium]|nr:sel1 repeat family protein [Alphaproteobacteria bacterium]
MSIKEPKSLKKRSQIIYSVPYQNKSFFPFQAQLLSSSSFHVILIASSLWLIQAIPLKAMEDNFKELPKGVPISLLSSTIGKGKSKEKDPVITTNFYEKDSQHPLTQKFWKERDLSKRLKDLKSLIDTINEDIINGSKSIDEFIKNNFNLDKCKEILKCTECNPSSPIQDLEGIHLHEQDLHEQDLISSLDRKNARMPKGWSKANVIIFPCIIDKPSVTQEFTEEGPNLIAVKKFDDIATGLKELFESIIALEINPAPETLKMARIYDAVLCPHNSLSIIMEAVGRQDIHTFLSTSSSEQAINAIKAFAEYLAIFHIKHHDQMKQNINNEKQYLKHVAYFFNSLFQNTLKEEDEKFKLLCLIPTEGLSKSKLVKSHNVVSLLTEKEQEDFEHLVTVNRNICRSNAEDIYRKVKKKQKLNNYFLTRTLGDAHAHNEFFNDDPNLRQENQEAISPDSFLRISVIDFASILKTAMPIGDPAEDVGRFLAALWNWRAIEKHTDEEAAFFQTEFLDHYLRTIKKSPIINFPYKELFEKVFKQNCSFYKLRYYRVLFNAEKDNKSLDNDREIKKIFLKSWIKENTELGFDCFLPSYKSQYIHIRELKGDFWGEPICKDRKEIKSWLPQNDNDFVDRTERELKENYIACIWKAFHLPEDKLTKKAIEPLPFSKAVIITGMGGVGKTSLTLEYGHQCLHKRAYNLIYWLHAGTDSSLIKGYINLLEYVGIPIKNNDNDAIIKSLQEYVSSKRCLLIYDNVPDYYEDVPGYYENGKEKVAAPNFLKDKIPQNAHILISSRCKEGWKEQGGQLIELDVFLPKESIDYLRNVTRRPSEEGKFAEKLAKELEYLPLALSHAAYYIKLAEGNFSEYLEDFKKAKAPIKYMAENRNLFEHAEAEITYANLIARTLFMTEKYIDSVGDKHISELAKKLLNYSAYLDPDSIVDEIFPEYDKQSENVKEALRLLTSLSLIKKIHSQSLFSIHRLEQLVIIAKLEEEKHHQQIFEDISGSFYNLFNKNPIHEKELPKLLSYLTHIQTLLDHSRTLKFFSKNDENLEWIGNILSVVEVNDDLNNCVSFLDKERKERIMNKYLKTQVRIIRNITDKLLKKKENFFTPIANITRETYSQMLSKNIIKPEDVDVYDKFPIETVESIPDWLEKIVGQSCPKLQTALALVYCGCSAILTLEKNYNEAFFWFFKAAEQQDADAEFKLGLLYAATLKDNATALQYLKKAANKGHAKAQHTLGIIYDIILGKPAKNDEVTEETYCVQLLFGELPDIFTVEKNDNESIKWYKKAANQGYAEPQYLLSAKYRKEGNFDEAFLWSLEAANQGHMRSQYALALLYKNSWGVPEALKWFILAAEQGLIAAQNDLGMIYATGQGDEINIAEAIKWFTMAAEKGDPEGQYNLGLIYANIQEKFGDIEKAVKWLTKATEQGHLLARKELEDIHKKVVCNVNQRLLNFGDKENYQGQSHSKLSELMKFLSAETSKYDDDNIAVIENLKEILSHELQQEENLDEVGKELAKVFDKLPNAEIKKIFSTLKHQATLKEEAKGKLIDKENTISPSADTIPQSSSERETTDLTMKCQKLETKDHKTCSKADFHIMRGDDRKERNRNIPQSSTGNDESNCTESNKTALSPTTIQSSTSSLYTTSSQSFSSRLSLDIEQIWYKAEEEINLKTIEGEKYMLAATQHEAERNDTLTEHCKEVADQFFQEAEDAQCALDFQKKEYFQYLQYSK